MARSIFFRLGLEYDGIMAYSDVVSKDIPDCLDNVITREPAGISPGQATLRGEIEGDGIRPHFQWSDTEGDLYNSTSKPDEHVKDGDRWSFTISGLEVDKDYYYRAGAFDVCQEIWVYGETKSFYVPETLTSWEQFYDDNRDEEFGAPLPAFDYVGVFTGSIFDTIINTSESFLGHIDPGQAGSLGEETGGVIPIARAYVEELDNFFGGAPVSFAIYVFVGVMLLILLLKVIGFIVSIIPFV